MTNIYDVWYGSAPTREYESFKNYRQAVNFAKKQSIKYANVWLDTYDNEEDMGLIKSKCFRGKE